MPLTVDWYVQLPNEALAGDRKGLGILYSGVPAVGRAGDCRAVPPDRPLRNPVHRRSRAKRLAPRDSDHERPFRCTHPSPGVFPPRT